MKKVIPFVFVFSSIALVGIFQNFTATPVDTLIPCSDLDKEVTIKITQSGNYRLEKNCSHYGSIRVRVSNVNLNCNGARLWGVHSSMRNDLTSNHGSFDFEKASNAGVDIFGYDDKERISNINVSNCKLSGFKQGVKVRHSLGISEAFFKSVKDGELGSEISNLYSKYLDEVDVGTKDAIRRNFVSALKKVNWEESKFVSSIPNRLRAETPANVRLQNLEISGVKGGVYIDHHVTKVTIDKVSIKEAHGGIYLELGSRGNSILNSFFETKSRESIAIDSSAENLIQGSVFRGAGIYLYRNCWENFRDPFGVNNYFPRIQSSNNNSIYQNRFEGDGQDDAVGIWVASRMSKAINFGNAKHKDGDGCGMFEIGKLGDLRYHQDSAKNNAIIGNTFLNYSKAVVVEDDNNRILGNRFEKRTIKTPITIGSNIKQQILNSPTAQNRASLNVFYGATSSDELVKMVYGSSSLNGVCSSYGSHQQVVSSYPCSDNYVSIIRKSKWYSYFEPSVVRNYVNYYYGL